MLHLAWTPIHRDNKGDVQLYRSLCDTVGPWTENTYYVDRVECPKCLHQLANMGRAAEERMRELGMIRDVIVPS
jgi:hypothetical protein